MLWYATPQADAVDPVRKDGTYLKRRHIPEVHYITRCPVDMSWNITWQRALHLYHHAAAQTAHYVSTNMYNMGVYS